MVPEQEGDEDHYLVPWYPTVDEWALRELWPRMSAEDLEGLIFELCYVQHGGSGLGFSHRDVLEFDVAYAMRMAERLYRRRSEEVAAVKRASRGKR